MGRPTLFKDRDKEYFISVIEETNGNVMQAQSLLFDRGYRVGYESLRMLWRNKDSYKDETKIRGLKDRAKRKNDFSIEDIKIAVKVFEANNFDVKGTLKILKNQDINITAQTIRKWYKLYAKEVCDTVRFRDVVTNITSQLTEKYGDFANSVYTTKSLIIAQCIKLIPQETDLDKLAKLYTALQKATETDPTNNKEGITLIQQYNQYFANLNKNEDTKNRDQGNIQDVTPERE
jgi:hypothetical protein